MGCKDALKTTKLLLRVFGAMVSAVLLTEAVLTFLSPAYDDFFGFCHWFGSGLMGLLVGGMGVFLEVRGSMSAVANQFQWFALNRIVLSIYYFWLGCWVMGGVGALRKDEGLKMLARVSGFIAWAVALGDLLVSCTAECRARDQEVAKAAAEKTVETGEAPDVSGATSGPEYGTHGIATFPTGLPPNPETIGKHPTPAVPTGASTSDIELDLEGPKQSGPFEEPPGGWNSNATAKPFGCS